MARVNRGGKVVDGISFPIVGGFVEGVLGF